MSQRLFLTTDIRALFESGKKLAYKKGEIIIRAGDTPQGAHYILRGAVKVYSITDNGEENIHLIYIPGEIFPLIWVFMDSSRNVYYEALTNTEILRVNRDELIADINRVPGAAVNMLRQVVEQYSVAADRIDNLQHRSAHGRVIYRLIFMASRFGISTAGGILIDLPITHQTIANSLNLARETVSRELEKLEEKGLILFQHHQILLPDIHLLQEEIGDSISDDMWGLGRLELKKDARRIRL